MNKQHTVHRALSHANSLKLDIKQLDKKSKFKLVLIDSIIRWLESQVVAEIPVDYDKVRDDEYHNRISK